MLKFINEVQAHDGFSQDIPFEQLKVLVDIGVIHHVQTSLYETHIHRYFVPSEDKHSYVVYDYSQGVWDISIADQVVADRH